MNPVQMLPLSHIFPISLLHSVPKSSYPEAFALKGHNHIVPPSLSLFPASAPHCTVMSSHHSLLNLVWKLSGAMRHHYLFCKAPFRAVAEWHIYVIEILPFHFPPKQMQGRLMLGAHCETHAAGFPPQQRRELTRLWSSQSAVGGLQLFHS